MKSNKKHIRLRTVATVMLVAMFLSTAIGLGVANRYGWFRDSGLVGVDERGEPLLTAADCAASMSNQEYIVTQSGQYIYRANNGSSLEEVVENLRKAEYESICGFDYVGNKLLDCTSYRKNTAYTTSAMREDFLNLGGMVMAHNHPSGNSFSGQDIYVEASYRTPCAMVISDTYVYTLTPGAWGWGDPEALLQYWQASYSYHLDYALSYTRNYYADHQAIIAAPDVPNDDTMAWVCNRAIKDAAVNGDVGPIKVPVGGWVSHMTMLDVAARFGLGYQRYLTDEFSEAALGIFWPSTTDVADEVVIWD